jgi:hypothetical protein
MSQVGKGRQGQMAFASAGPSRPLTQAIVLSLAIWEVFRGAPVAQIRPSKTSL